MRQIVIHVPEDRSFEVMECLQEVCGLRNVTKNTEDGIVQLTALADSHSSGYVMYQLDKIGCGVAYGKIVLIPVSVVKPLPRGNAPVVDKANTWYKQLASAKAAPLGALFPSTSKQADQQELRSKFSRLAVEEIYSVVDAGCAMTADYFSYIFVGSMIAAVGLATNNSVMIVASMLVSPLMGPILGFTYGTAIWDVVLIRRGVLAELAGVSMTVLIGFVAGLIISGWGEVPSKYDWPTDEMTSRGDKASLLVGVFFAVPSGVGVALSATQGGVNSLVGVAIAASLLPPVVNVGMCLAYALVGDDHVHNASMYFELAGISLSLFMLNIGIIYVVCLCVFRFKKISPVRRQLSRYQDLPPLKVEDPNLAISSDGGIGSDLAGHTQVAMAPSAGAPLGFESNPHAGATLELRSNPKPHPASKLQAHPCAAAPDAKVDGQPNSSILSHTLAHDKRTDPCDPLSIPMGSTSSSSCASEPDIDGDVDRSSSARLLEHVQGQGKGSGGGKGASEMSCACAQDPPLAAWLEGRQGMAGPVMTGGLEPLQSAKDSAGRDAPEAAKLMALAMHNGQDPLGGMGEGGMHETGLLGPLVQGPSGTREAHEGGATPEPQSRQVPEMLGDQVLALASDLVQAKPQQQQQQQQPQQLEAIRQYHQQLSHSLSNEWTLDDSTVKAWAHEVASCPKSLSTSQRVHSSGQLELRPEQEAQLHARWNRLVEDHFGVKLEDVSEGKEEAHEEDDQETEGSTRDRPSFENKLQGFLHNLGKMVPHSESSGHASDGVQSSEESCRHLSCVQSANVSAGRSNVPGEQGSGESFGSQAAFAHKGCLLSRQSVLSNPEDGGREACKEKPGRKAGWARSERDSSGTRAPSGAGGGSGREDLGGHTRCDVQVGDAGAGAGAEAPTAVAFSRASSGAWLRPANEGRITRTPGEAWSLVRQAVCTSKAAVDDNSNNESSQAEHHLH
ncbi:hypothetical protein DUNSADRAFT_7012 [Dunaliella salina]|uniref:DUF389 domain-containing protein n=1 Tax=Dunaliella salina TaxID=3046 RepID=A0ABQ7GM44_DUNSA|nr:hypothetical protein DUNSADRAFT_7012 [Dunaliella salina]|eukprot:KAF5835684.1 hypothetical protein DUNSADRAFT_7012 [Dunaliella salina]